MSELWETGGRHGRGAVDRSTLPRVSARDVPLRRIGALFWPHRGKLAGVLVLSLAATAFGLLPPLAIKWIIDWALPARDATMLVVLVAVLAVAPLAAGLTGVAYDRMNQIVG